MIRRGRKAQGGIKKGSRGGEFTITASGKKNYVSHGPKKVPHATAAHRPPFLTTERKKQILAGTIIALSLVAAGASAYGAHTAAQERDRAKRLPKDPFNPSGPHPDWHVKSLNMPTRPYGWHDKDPLHDARETLHKRKIEMLQSPQHRINSALNAVGKNQARDNIVKSYVEKDLAALGKTKIPSKAASAAMEKDLVYLQNRK